MNETLYGTEIESEFSVSSSEESNSDDELMNEEINFEPCFGKVGLMHW